MNEGILRVLLGCEISVTQVFGFLRYDIGVVVHGIFISTLLVTIFHHCLFCLCFVRLTRCFCLWLGPQLRMNYITPSSGVCAVVSMVVTVFGSSSSGI